jgi:DnaJ domain
MTDMNLNSPLFDRIRAKSKPKQEPEPRIVKVRCNHPGCDEAGEFRAPMGRDYEGQYFSFCLDHVREYNATYNYFNGMTPEAVALYQREAVVGHRPTWSMGVNRGDKTFREDSDDPSRRSDAHGVHGRRAAYRAAAEAPKPQLGIAAKKALDQLGIDEGADSTTIRARYKELVKRLHPDANGGDRSREEKLREIIRAYNYLKSIKLA